MKTAEMNQTIEVDDKELTLTRLNKVMYPKTGFTKANIFDYYTRISPYMIPHLKNRMLTLKRYPDGAGAPFFYEKRCPSYKPSWLKTKSVKSTHDRADIPYCEIDSRAALLWIANLGTLELHVLLSSTQNVDWPTCIVFDLDPGPGMTMRDCCRFALTMRAFLKTLKLECFAKTSGQKGIHLYIPLNTTTTFDDTKDFAHQIASTLERKYPEEITANMKKELRQNKIFIDWSQNDSHKTTVCVYSLRATEKPSVSTPLKWSEVEAGAAKSTPLIFSPADTLKRVEKYGDLFEAVLTLKQKLTMHDREIAQAA